MTVSHAKRWGALLVCTTLIGAVSTAQATQWTNRSKNYQHQGMEFKKRYRCKASAQGGKTCIEQRRNLQRGTTAQRTCTKQSGQVKFSCTRWQPKQISDWR